MKNEKKQDQLQDALGKIDEKLVARAARQPMKFATKIKWISSVAAVLVVCIVFSALMGSGVLSSPQNGVVPPHGDHVSDNILLEEPTELDDKSDFIPQQLPMLLSAAKYPQMTKYPGEEKGMAEEYRQWREDCKARRSYFGAGDGLEPFFERTVSQFLGDAETKNAVYSPLNVYMALAMIAETAAGNTQKQILDMLGIDSIDALREQAYAIWNANYRDDGLVTSVLANSVWLNSDRDFNQETLDALAEYYYTSTYNGDMADKAYLQAMHDWINAQTRNALKDQVDALIIPSDTVMALISSLYFCADWQSYFYEKENTQGIFHSVAGDETCEFMHDRRRKPQVRGYCR